MKLTKIKLILKSNDPRSWKNLYHPKTYHEFETEAQLSEYFKTNMLIDCSKIVGRCGDEYFNKIQILSNIEIPIHPTGLTTFCVSYSGFVLDETEDFDTKHRHKIPFRLEYHYEYVNDFVNQFLEEKFV